MFRTRLQRGFSVGVVVEALLGLVLLEGLLTRRTDYRHFGSPEQVSPGVADGVKQRILTLTGASAPLMRGQCVKRRREEAGAATSEQRCPGSGSEVPDRTYHGRFGNPLCKWLKTGNGQNQGERARFAAMPSRVC